MSKHTLGIHSGHNATVALITNGELRFAVQEERITRVKNQGGIPVKSLFQCSVKLDSSKEVNAAIAGVNITRFDWSRDKMLSAYVNHGPMFFQSMKSYLRGISPVAEAINKKRERLLEQMIGRHMEHPPKSVVRFEHHECHAAAAYFGWGKMDDQVLILTCDGSGDGICATVNVGYEGQITRLAAVPKDHSIGRLYANVTHFMGMTPLEHEYKLMGLAPYAIQSGEAQAIAKELETLFVHDQTSPLTWKRKNGCPPIQRSLALLARLFHRRRFDYIAAGTQLFTERFLTKWVRKCIRETGIRKVALSGGVFMNVKANQKILELPEVEELFVFPSCGDETNAIGAAYLLSHQLQGNPPGPISHLYLGLEFDNYETEKTLSQYEFRHRVKIQHVKDIEKKVAELISAEKIVARFKGAMEFGARSLGNRSILGNPSKSDVVRVINHMIKSRDFWMPFAPSVLAERSTDYVEKPKEMPGPYMIMTFDTKEHKRDAMWSVIHPQDFTTRPHEVYPEWNPEYYRLIKHFEEMTGEGILLNTSFNLHGEPIVCTPADALRVFDLSGLEYLALGQFLVSKV